MSSIVDEWIMNMKHLWSDKDREKPKHNNCERNLYQSILSPTLLTRRGLGLNRASSFTCDSSIILMVIANYD